MYFAIETIDQLSRLEPQSSAFLHLIPNNYGYHPKLASVCAYYYRANDKGYIISVNHSDCFSLDNQAVLEFINAHQTIYVLDKKYHSHFIKHKNLVECDLLYQRTDRSFTNLQAEFDRLHRADPELNSLVPIVKHYEHCEALYSQYADSLGKHVNCDSVIEAYAYVESNPIRIDRSKFFDNYAIGCEAFSIQGDLIYNQYNLGNQTGRPTNSFNGVNFLAITKDESHRSCFLPTNDYFVEFDFDAYHLRLIANEVNYEFHAESIHEYLGKQYFNKEELTEDEYKESKTISFRNLYGGVPEAHQSIPFFKQMSILSKTLSEGCEPGHTMELPTGIKLTRDFNMGDSKLLNYYVQNLETKRNAEKILKLKQLLVGKATKLCLITYDAFLFDYSLEDGKQLLIEIKKILEEDNMKVKHKFAKNYFL